MERVMRMKKMISIFMLCFSVTALHSFDWALTGASVTHFPDGSVLSDGMYGQIGFRAVLTPRLESELLFMPQITPRPLDSFAVGLLAGFNILGPVEPPNFNMILDAGLLYTFTPEDAKGKPVLHARISPLVIGNPIYKHRGRMFTLGLLYDIPDQRFSWSFSTVIHNWFVSRHSER